MTKQKKDETQPNFEQALGDLKNIVERLEQGQLSLEDSLKQFEQGVQLGRHCQKALSEAEQTVQRLSRLETNSPLVDFPSGDITDD